MTLHDAGMYFSYLSRNPPLRAIVAGIAIAIGVPVEELFKTKAAEVAEPKKKYFTADDFRRLLSVTGGQL